MPIRRLGRLAANNNHRKCLLLGVGIMFFFVILAVWCEWIQISDSVGKRNLDLQWGCSIEEYRVHYWKTGDMRTSETIGKCAEDFRNAEIWDDNTIEFAVRVPGSARLFSDIIVGERWLVMVASKNDQYFRKVMTITSETISHGVLEIACPTGNRNDEWAAVIGLEFTGADKITPLGIAG